ncbi:tetratricopeptide repeat protein, partial [Vibrio aerogenes]
MLFVLSLCAIAALGFGSYVLYYIIPSGFQSRHAEGPKVLTELLHMAEQSKPFNPDPYIASTYRPENPLYQPVLEIQRHRWDIAEKLLEPLAEKGNADAMFWLAEITYGSPYRSSRAAHLYQKSAELGNPYAALRLDADNSDCQRFMFGYCKEKWGKLGRKLLKQRADNGDLKAAYYLLKLDIDVYSDSAEVHKKLEQLVTENAKQHYYQPLMSLLGGYVRHGYYGPYLDKDSPVDKQDIVLVNKILTLLANNNYPLALSTVILDDREMFSSQYIG